MKARLLSFLFLFVLTSGYGATLLFQKNAADSLAYYSNKVERPTGQNDLESAYAYFLKYRENAVLRKDTLAMIYGLQRLATIERSVGLQVESESSAVEALQLADKKKLTPYLKALKASVYNHLGILYKEQGLYAKAQTLYEQSLAHTETARDSMIVYLNLGNILLKESKYDQSELYFEKALRFVPRVTDSVNIARVWTGMGYVKHKQQAEGGLSLMREALELRKRIEDLKGLYSGYKYLSVYYDEISKPKAAAAYRDSAYATATLLKSPLFKEDALKLLIQSGSNQEAQTYIALSDSLEKANVASKNKFTLIKYDFDTLNRKVLENKLVAQKAQSKSVMLLFAILIVVLLSIGFMFWLQSHNRKKRLKEVYATESRISSRVHDEVANTVYHIMAKVQSKPVEQETLLDDLEEIYLKTRQISRDNSVVFTEDFSTSLKDLFQSFQSEQVNIVVRGLSKVQWNHFSELKKITLYKVLQELMINMRKHSKASIAAVSFDQTGQKLHIQYTDNGQGSMLKKQLGLQITENRIRSIEGSITFETAPEKGFKVKMVM
ncbi:MAG TPA: tetratricopeptide repeat protein [Flavobacteriaceae bacterium]|nr:tetratricopeptide repeat protein [Flavobacteriaceae bacterium]